MPAEVIKASEIQNALAHESNMRLFRARETSTAINNKSFDEKQQSSTLKTHRSVVEAVSCSSSAEF